MRIRADQHVHSHHSGDSEAPMEAIADRALALGLSDLCFTEHNDFDYPDVGDPRLTPITFLLDTAAYEAEFLRLREAFAGRISLHFGVELGLQPHVAQENRAFVRARPFDLVIASIHVANRRDPYFPNFYAGRTEEDGMREVLEDTLRNIQCFDDFDVLGHMDYIIRYLPSGRQTMDMSPFLDVIDEILRLLISRGQGLDLNTSQLWKKGYPEMNPCRQILRRYRALGGRVVTFGSDAHEAEHIAGSFDQAQAIALECGFTEYCVFEGRRPSFLPLG